MYIRLYIRPVSRRIAAGRRPKKIRLSRRFCRRLSRDQWPRWCAWCKSRDYTAVHSIENYIDNYYVQCSQQLRRTEDEKFKIEAESYLSFTLCEENSPRTRRIRCYSGATTGITFRRCRYFAGLSLGMSAGSMAVESLLILCYSTNMQQPAIKLITSNTAQVNFLAWQPGLYHRAVFNFRVIESVA